MFKTIKENEIFELVEKKSKFIASVYYVESEDDAENKIKEMKKRNKDARHNCFAFSIWTENGIINRFSDDGEPSGTAGSPMLNIINSKNLANILIVVTRYFGGVLLGTGGLVRAYTGASLGAIEKCEIVEKSLGVVVRFEIIYSELEKFKYYLRQNNINIVDIEYNEKIFLKIEMLKVNLETIIKNKEDFKFNIIKYEVIEKKYIII